MKKLTAAFVPLTDSAVLLAAERLGFARAEGLELDLVRDASWATVRDRLVYGQAHVAHLLGPLAVAVTLGLSQHRVPLVAPFNLSLNGNALTVSSSFAAAFDPVVQNRISDPVATAHDFAGAVGLHRRKPAIGIVHRFSSHALMLRYWLASAAINPDRDIELKVLPPPLMGDALAAGEIDGFIAGEPWPSSAIDSGAAEIIAVGAHIWRRGVEKVLAMREDWAESHADTVDALLRALDKAAAWCDAPQNKAELAAMLAEPEAVGQPAEVIARALEGRLVLKAGGEPFTEPDFVMFHREAANFPWRSQALWIYAQMLRWGHIEPSPAAEAAAAQVFRPDIYRRALAGGLTPMPGASAKVEGSLDRTLAVGSDRGTLVLGPDRFFDGRVFDPSDIAGYLASFSS